MLEGNLKKQGNINQSFKMRFFKQQEDKLYYYINKESKSPQGHIDLSKMISVTPDEKGFDILTNNRVYHMMIVNNDLNYWIKGLRSWKRYNELLAENPNFLKEIQNKNLNQNDDNYKLESMKEELRKSEQEKARKQLETELKSKNSISINQKSSTEQEEPKNQIYPSQPTNIIPNQSTNQQNSTRPQSYHPSHQIESNTTSQSNPNFTTPNHSTNQQNSTRPQSYHPSHQIESNTTSQSNPNFTTPNHSTNQHNQLSNELNSNEIALLKKQIEKLKNEAQDLLQEISNKNNNTNTLHSDKIRLEQQLNEVQLENNYLKGYSESLLLEIKKKDQVIFELQERIKNLQLIEEQSYSEENVFKKELKKAKENIFAHQNRIRFLSEQYEKIERELEFKKRSYELKDQKLVELLNKVVLDVEIARKNLILSEDPKSQILNELNDLKERYFFSHIKSDKIIFIPPDISIRSLLASNLTLLWVVSNATLKSKNCTKLPNIFHTKSGIVGFRETWNLQKKNKNRKIIFVL